MSRTKFPVILRNNHFEKEVVVGGNLLTEMPDKRAELVRSVLMESPGLLLNESGELLIQKHGLRLSRASLGRLPQQVDMVPDSIQSRAATAKFKKAA